MSISITSPSAGATVSGTVNVTGNSSQTVTGPLSSSQALASQPFTLVVNTALLANGSQTLSVSNGVTSTGVSVTVNNSAGGAPKLFYGVNIHHMASVYQSLGPAAVIATLHDIGFTAVRTDVYSPGDASLLVTWCSAFAAANPIITPVPILIAQVIDGNESASYANGVALGVAIANAVGAYTNYFEMGNELDDYCQPQLDGLQPSCYSQAQWVGARGAMRGVYDGVKSVKPGAMLVMAGQTELCEGFTNGMLTGVDPAGHSGGAIVQFDRPCWHWYESSGDITNTGSSGQPGPCGSPNGGLNMLAFMQSLGKGATWLTEIGNSGGDSQSQQASYVTAAMTQYYNARTTYNIEATFWYELIIVSGSGGNYGLLASNGTTKRTAYTTMKNFIAAHPV